MGMGVIRFHRKLELLIAPEVNRDEGQSESTQRVSSQQTGTRFLRGDHTPSYSTTVTGPPTAYVVIAVLGGIHHLLPRLVSVFTVRKAALEMTTV